VHQDAEVVRKTLDGKGFLDTNNVLHVQYEESLLHEEADKVR
jgi:hypothetical protein